MNLITLSEKYNTHEKCLKYLTSVRWGKKTKCPRCEGNRITPRSLKSKGQFRKTPLFHCNKCNKDFSVLTDTIFEGTKLPLNKWFYIISMMMNAKKGISSLQLSRELGINQSTSWYCCMRLRVAMTEQETDLNGIVEMDTTYVGGKPRYRYDKANPKEPIVKGLRGKGTKKVPVVAMIERNGRVVAKMMNRNPTTEMLLKLFRTHVDVNNVRLMTDEGTEFKRFSKLVPHETVNHERKEYARIDEKTNTTISTNTVEGFFGMLKNSIKANFHAVSKKYLPFYLAEYCYRYNTRHDQKFSFDKTIGSTLSVVKKLLNYKPLGTPFKIAYEQEGKKVS